MGEGKRGKPAGELERLRVFETLATEYFRMVELFAPDGGPAPADPAGAERRHWVELFRAALLRKFIVRDEHVSLKLVVRALRLCNIPADPTVAEGTDAVVRLFTPEMLQGRRPEPPGTASAGAFAGGALTNDAEAQDVFDDVLYGRLLHGDADRFRRSGWADDYTRMSAAAAARFEAEHALAKALEVVSYGLAHGLLRPPAAGGHAMPPAPGPQERARH
ncbi:hypothetical protein [Arthrobacter sp. PM3]|uniref:hypothetical protein n=1 Tax=Arthrobacter sp. PM3 TaxID=2017685 RepID=UPI000E10B6B1|nr:hypothetical protein [Arthrobacter sp. PM3]AXJ10684.1 hypothetical protein CFN17_14465 [Arthrobacter sp. PM3]